MFAKIKQNLREYIGLSMLRQHEFRMRHGHPPEAIGPWLFLTAAFISVTALLSIIILTLAMVDPTPWVDALLRLRAAQSP